MTGSPWHDYRDQAVLITGGTRGIGLATALAFGRRGAHVTMTYKWGSADEDELREKFAGVGASPPDIVRADVACDDDVRMVLDGIRARHGHVEALVSNVAFAALVHSVDEYAHRGLVTSINYTAWPLVSHTLMARELCGRPPRYVVGISSSGNESMLGHYDFVAASKAVLESLCRYLHYRLREEGSRVNVVRTRFVDTESLAATAGDEFAPFLRRYEPDVISTPDEVAEAIFGVCSGLLDALGGQVLTVDRGAGSYENFSRLYTERDRYPITPRRSPR